MESINRSITSVLLELKYLTRLHLELKELKKEEEEQGQQFSKANNEFSVNMRQMSALIFLLNRGEVLKIVWEGSFL